MDLIPFTFLCAAVSPGSFASPHVRPAPCGPSVRACGKANQAKGNTRCKHFVMNLLDSTRRRL